MQTPTIGQIIGARVRELRKASNLSQKELSRRTGIHRPISRIERGLHEHRVDTSLRLAIALGTEASTFFECLDDRTTRTTEAAFDVIFEGSAGFP